MIAPFWPFEEKQVSRLTWMPRGALLRQKNPDYDGYLDGVDAEFNVEVAELDDLSFEVHDNDEKVRATACFRDHYLSRWLDADSRAAAKAWCEGLIDELQAEGQRLLEVSAKFEPGLYLHRTWHDGPWWTVVSVTKEGNDGVAHVWFIGSEVDGLITDQEWEYMVPLDVTAPDGVKVG